MPITAAQLEKRIDRIGDLPTFPSVVKHISLLVEDKKSSAADIGSLIAKDQVISAKILRLVNSPVYGFPSRMLGFGDCSLFDHGLQGLTRKSMGHAVIERSGQID